jgi:tripartite ATP-independent transporter DctM subunit
MTVAILLCTFFAALLLGIPVVWSMALASVAAISLTDISLPLAWLAQQFFRGADSLTLAAVPMFLLAGGMMNQGGLTRRIMTLAEDLLGWMRGALGPVNVATAMIYGGVSGSATADTGAVGSIMIPAMAERGYSKAFAAAVTAASGTLGIIIPPSIIFILYGVITGTSIGGLFAAGILPGIVIGIAFMVVAWLIGRARGFARSERRPRAREVVRDSILALPALAMPVVIIGSMLGGVATATEAAAISVVYAWLVGTFVYGELTLQSLPKLALETVRTTGAIMIILAAATPFSWILTLEQVPLHAANLVKIMAVSPELAVAAIILLLLFVGLWMDLGPALLVLAPIIKPIGLGAGLDPLQLGIIVTVALGVGLFTPPVGTNIFVVCNIARLPIGDVVRELVPFWAASVICLVLIAAIPELSTFLPRLMGF